MFSLFELCCSGHVVYKGNTSVSEGERFVITCNLTMFDPVKWEKDGVALVPDLKNKYVFEEENEPGGGILARLEVDSALPLHSGTYRCNSFHNESHLLIVRGKRLVWLMGKLILIWLIVWFVKLILRLVALSF